MDKNMPIIVLHPAKSANPAPDRGGNKKQQKNPQRPKRNPMHSQHFPLEPVPGYAIAA